MELMSGATTSFITAVMDIVTEKIAGIRGISTGTDAISPNRHTDINSNAEQLDMIRRVRTVSGKPAGFKAVMGAYGWLNDLFEEIDARGIESAPDFTTVDGADGGTGTAPPMPLIDDVGLPLRESLPLLVDKLNEYGIRIAQPRQGDSLGQTDHSGRCCLGVVHGQ